MARFKVATVDGYEIVVEHQGETASAARSCSG
jgi:hypothetical protein